MASRRADNQSLRGLLTTAGWTYEALARTVNAIGAENGVPLHYDRTAVAHWLRGSVPRPRTRELIAEAFTRRLGRTVTPVDLGMEDHPPSAAVGIGPPGKACADRAPHATARLAALCTAEADPVGRRSLQQSVYSAAGLDVSAWQDLLGRCRPQARPTGGREEHAEEAEGVRAAVGFFDRACDFGGRYARTALVAYLNDDVVPGLRARPPGAAGRLPAETARLVHVLARMYADDLRNGAAQHYYRAALHLAAEAGDRLAYVLVLRGMSAHALEVGHCRAALRLAAEAVRTAPGDAPPCARALLLSHLALVRARTGDRCQAAACLAAAEQHHGGAPEHDTAGRGTPSFCARASLALLKGRTLAALDDRTAAVAVLRLSVEHRDADAYRPRALAHAEIARLLLGDGRLEEACAAWHRFLDDYPHLRSGRADRVLAGLRGELRAHAARRPVRALLQRAAAVGGRAHSAYNAFDT